MFFWLQRRRSIEYDAVLTDPKSLESSISDDTEHTHGASNIPLILPWITTFLFGMLALFQYLVTRSCSSSNSWETGWATEFGPARHLIEVETVRFNGAPAYNEDGDMFIPHPGPIRYVGSPTKEIDEAWKDLINPRYFRISEDEAEETYGRDYKQYWNPEYGSYITGLDMFHTLHCLDYIRRFIHPEYYSIEKYEDSEMHFGHCVEQIRQYIMCAGDLTPIPTRYFPSVKHSYVDPEQTHTCRNFDKIRGWVLERVSANVTKSMAPFN